MNYKQTLEYLYSRLPMFQRVGAAAYKADLSNTIAICKLLGNPEKDFPAVHIAGTNGKGSTANMVASVLTESGFKTGLFTSPHLRDFRERIRVNGIPVPQDYVVDFVENYGDEAASFEASFFELTFGMAMKYFSDAGVDIAVVEVGMGGRLDSTNVVSPLVTAITNISLDHTAFLGEGIEKIAAEKAGIIKKGVPVIIGRRQKETKKVFEAYADRMSSAMYYADELVKIEKENNGVYWYTYKNEERKALDMPLQGDYQKENLATALAILKTLSGKKGFEKVVRHEQLERGIKNIISNTGFAGRWQILSENPMVICDTGHNVDGLRKTMQQLENLNYRQLHFVLGMVSDKDIAGVITLLPKHARYYFCRAGVPRAMPAEELMEKASFFGLEGHSYPSVADAFKAAKENAGDSDLVFVGGSTFVVAEVV